MSSPQQESEQCFEACDRFFSIHELVSLFLHQAPPLVVLKCQRVCTLFHEIIQQSPRIQQNLFREPIRPEDHDRDRPLVPHLNPILWECFGPVLAGPDPADNHASAESVYVDLRHLPWARDGRHRRAPAREAYAREGASWREMYVSQPPIRRLDWWHSWTAERSRAPESPGTQAPDYEISQGWGHQDEDTFLTIGLLWDLVESRLKRGCRTRVLYFPQGCAATADSTAHEEELGWERDRVDSQHRGYTTTGPRIKIQTTQVWKDEGPQNYQKFNLNVGIWETEPLTEPQYRPDYGGDGFNWLRHDCRRDLFSESVRWSKSEVFEHSEIRGESSGYR